MRLLLAEDERELSDVLVTIFKQSHYTVDAVFDGENALEFGLQKNYDGIILDIMMPKKNGLEVLTMLRNHGVLTPVLLLTAKSDVSDRVKGLDLGANDYLAKPFATKELLARIRAMMRRPYDRKSPEITIGNVVLNSSSFELSTGNSSVRLSSKEYKMMEMLIENHGRNIIVDQFLEQIWSNDSNIETNVVWVYASYLQKKLTAIGGGIEIEMSRTDGIIRINENLNKSTKTEKT
jgi:DNA-binding response OmpR family regulator